LIDVNRFSYRVYYDYRRPTQSDPPRSRKTKDEIAAALARFPIELCSCFPDAEATISVFGALRGADSIDVAIVTTLIAATTHDSVVTCLDKLDLLAEEVSSACHWG
jgi:hypothetical protein